MTLEQLRIFVAVADRQHVTRAAEALNLTQSAVSSAVTALETRHGVKLFDRVGRNIVLNQAGETFLAEARAVLARAAAAEAALADLDVAMVLPSNEAVRGAVEAGVGAALMSRRVAAPRLQIGTLVAAPFDIPPRAFHVLRHKERYRSRAGDAFLEVVRSSTNS